MIFCCVQSENAGCYLTLLLEVVLVEKERVQTKFWAEKTRKWINAFEIAIAKFRGFSRGLDNNSFNTKRSQKYPHSIGENNRRDETGNHWCIFKLAAVACFRASSVSQAGVVTRAKHSLLRMPHCSVFILLTQYGDFRETAAGNLCFPISLFSRSTSAGRSYM